MFFLEYITWRQSYATSSLTVLRKSRVSTATPWQLNLEEIFTHNETGLQAHDSSSDDSMRHKSSSRASIWVLPCLLKFPPMCWLPPTPMTLRENNNSNGTEGGMSLDNELMRTVVFHPPRDARSFAFHCFERSSVSLPEGPHSTTKYHIFPFFCNHLQDVINSPWPVYYLHSSCKLASRDI